MGRCGEPVCWGGIERDWAQSPCRIDRLWGHIHVTNDEHPKTGGEESAGADLERGEEVGLPPGRMGSDGMRWDRLGSDGIGWDRTGWPVLACLELRSLLDLQRVV